MRRERLYPAIEDEPTAYDFLSPAQLVLSLDTITSMGSVARRQAIDHFPFLLCGEHKLFEFHPGEHSIGGVKKFEFVFYIVPNCALSPSPRAFLMDN
jgi:hypothetical protein